MSNILLVTSSPRGAASHSTAVATALAERLAAQTGATITRRDVAADPVPHLDGAFLTGEAAAIGRSDALIAEVFAADTIIIASAMVNFAPASTLKAWFDNLLRQGKTFRYSERGAEGLVTGKTAYIVTASGGIYADGPQKVADFQLPYLRHLLEFMGIVDVETIAVEGVAFGPAQAEQSVAAALARVDTIAAGRPLAA